MSTYLLTWNPTKHFKWDDLPQYVAEIARNGTTVRRWSFGKRKNAEIGDRVFLIKLGANLPRGIVGSGTIVELPYIGIHWEDENKTALYVHVEFDALLNPNTDSILLREELNSPKFSAMHWNAESSGTEIPDKVAKELEKRWLEVLSVNNRKPSLKFQYKRTFENKNYWWVNHNQNHKRELEDGFIWSPKKDQNGAINQAYLNLPKTKINDIIFSYADMEIKAIGVIKGRCRSSSRPLGAGEVGKQSDKEGWHVPVDWLLLIKPFRPKNFIKQIAPLLKEKYSPILSNGDGNRKCYLGELRGELGQLLIEITQTNNSDIKYLLEEKENSLLDDKELINIEYQEILQTQKEQLVKARIGQGLFRSRVEAIEKACRMTGVTDKRLLIASHIKAWRDSSNEERLDGNNGFLLSPHVDKLFDKGLISFSDNGDVLCANLNVEQLMKMWGLNPNKNVGNFNAKQREYLSYHRNKFHF